MKGEKLDCDFAIELCIFGKIHLTHPARAQWRVDFVATHACARIETHPQCFSFASQPVTTVSGSCGVSAIELTRNLFPSGVTSNSPYFAATLKSAAGVPASNLSPIFTGTAMSFWSPEM